MALPFLNLTFRPLSCGDGAAGHRARTAGGQPGLDLPDDPDRPGRHLGPSHRHLHLRHMRALGQRQGEVPPDICPRCSESRWRNIKDILLSPCFTLQGAAVGFIASFLSCLTLVIGKFLRGGASPPMLPLSVTGCNATGAAALGLNTTAFDYETDVTTPYLEHDFTTIEPEFVTLSRR